MFDTDILKSFFKLCNVLKNFQKISPNQKKVTQKFLWKLMETNLFCPKQKNFEKPREQNFWMFCTLRKKFDKSIILY